MAWHRCVTNTQPCLCTPTSVCFVTQHQTPSRLWYISWRQMFYARRALTSHMQPVDIFLTCHCIHITRHVTMSYQLSCDKIFRAAECLHYPALNNTYRNERYFSKITGTPSFKKGNKQVLLSYSLARLPYRSSHSPIYRAIQWRYCWRRIWQTGQMVVTSCSVTNCTLRTAFKHRRLATSHLLLITTYTLILAH